MSALTSKVVPTPASYDPVKITPPTFPCLLRRIDDGRIVLARDSCTGVVLVPGERDNYLGISWAIGPQHEENPWRAPGLVKPDKVCYEVVTEPITITFTP